MNKCGQFGQDTMYDLHQQMGTMTFISNEPVVQAKQTRMSMLFDSTCEIWETSPF